MMVDIEVDDLELCRVYEIRCDGILGQPTNASLLHGVGWYTRNANPE